MNDLERTQRFLQKAKEKFPQFNYSLVSSIKNIEETRIPIICPEHGEFVTTPKVLLKGKYGCPKCANILKAKKSGKNELLKEINILPEDLIPIENPIITTKDKLIGTVYCFINKINSKLYIGETVKSDYNERFNEHRSKSNNGINNYFYKAIRKYSWESFDKIIIFQTDVLDNTEENKKLLNDIVNKKETFYIQKYKTDNHSFGYNLTKGGDGIVGYKHSDETKQKLSESHTGEKHWHFGKLNTYNSRTILQLSLNGEIIKEWPSAAEIERQLGYKSSNVSNCCNNKIYSVHNFIFVKKETYTPTYIEDRKQLFKLAYKEVLQYDFLGNFIKEHNSSKEAATEFNCSVSSIQKAASGSLPQAKSYIWIYKKDYTEELLQNKLQQVKYCKDYNKIIEQI